MLMSVQTIYSWSEDHRFNYCITLLNLLILNSHSEVTETEVICQTHKVYLPNSGSTSEVVKNCCKTHLRTLGLSVRNENPSVRVITCRPFMSSIHFVLTFVAKPYLQICPKKICLCQNANVPILKWTTPFPFLLSINKIDPFC